MTPKELAQHWQVSESEAENISEYINRFYKLDILPVKEDSKVFWKGVMYAFDPNNKYILMESKDQFISRDQAILHWTNQIQKRKIPLNQARQMRYCQGVPTDAYVALKPVEGYERVIQQVTTPIFRLSIKQHD